MTIFQWINIVNKMANISIKSLKHLCFLKINPNILPKSYGNILRDIMNDIATKSIKDYRSIIDEESIRFFQGLNDKYKKGHILAQITEDTIEKCYVFSFAKIQIYFDSHADDLEIPYSGMWLFNFLLEISKNFPKCPTRGFRMKFLKRGQLHLWSLFQILYRTLKRLEKSDQIPSQLWMRYGDILSKNQRGTITYEQYLQKFRIMDVFQKIAKKKIDG